MDSKHYGAEFHNKGGGSESGVVFLNQYLAFISVSAAHYR